MPETSTNGLLHQSTVQQNGLSNGSYILGVSSKPDLTSPGHAKGQVQQGDDHDVQPSDASPSEFPDLDAALGLYNDLSLPNAPQTYIGSEGPVPLNDGENGGLLEEANTGLTEWYGDTVDDEVPEFGDEFEAPSAEERPIAEQIDGGANAIEKPQVPLYDVKVSAPPPPARTSESPIANVHVTDTEPLEESNLRSLPLDNSEATTPPGLAGQVRKRRAGTTEESSIRSTQSPARRPIISTFTNRLRDDYRPKSSIPGHLAPEDYASECIVAAMSSRLNPFAMHPEEYNLLRSHISHQQVTNYLNIRNGILRLWTKNPLVSVTAEEAAGCVRDSKWFNVADVAYEWLVRRGYINFGCVEPARNAGSVTRRHATGGRGSREVIVVIGAGMAGLGCARQLEGLLSHFSEHWTSRGMDVPSVIVLEGRQRIGGRIYSHLLKTQTPETLPSSQRCTVDMGAQIITGFDNGNPLNAIIRGQLGLHHHLLKDNSVLFDSDGAPVDKHRDQIIERLYNDILERASVFRHKVALPQLTEGDKDLIETGRDPTGDSGKIISVLEEAAAPLPLPGSGAESTRHDLPEPMNISDPVHTEVDRLTGKQHVNSVWTTEALVEALSRPKVSPGARADFELKEAASSTDDPTLGLIMDAAVKQYQKRQGLSPQDLRLMNWHYANLEYANAANVNRLSLAGWDQDTGNEFEGEHAQIIGGYLQVPRGISQSPYPLDIRTQSAVREVAYTPDTTSAAPTVRVTCEDGKVIDADRVVSTLPLGVMKARSVQFSPPLPDWKTWPIDRLGFGTLNKVVLVYDKPFWDEDRDMFGLLRDPAVEESVNQADYVQHRGRFYLFWNCLKTSGRPLLVALMAGDAAHQTEQSNPKDLVVEATQALAKVFAPVEVPEPQEVIISRWGKDRFARGSYSYVGSRAEPKDYDMMAKPVGNLHFAGEATCGTHPATVHGAYLSGLRAASEVLESLIGPIHVPSPLIASKAQQEPKPAIVSGLKRKAEETISQRQRAVDDERRRALEAEIQLAIHEELGERPTKPSKSAANPFLLYQRDHWHICKNRCDDAHRQSTKNPEAKATRNEVRAALGLMWREAPEDEKRPYLDQTANNKQSNLDGATRFQEDLAQWDRNADAIRRRHLAEQAGRSGAGSVPSMDSIPETNGAKRVKRQSSDNGSSIMEIG